MKEGSLITPVPVEYISFSELEKIKHTEKYYKDLSVLYQKLESEEGEGRKRVDILLKDSFDLHKLLELLTETELKRLCHYRYDFSLLKLFCQIAQLEKEFNEPCTLKNVCSMENLEEKYHTYMFLLRRFQFEMEAGNELADLIKCGELSYICLSELMFEKGIIQKKQTTCRITEYLYEKGCYREAFLFIMRMEHRLPYDDQKVIHFAMKLLNLGERRLAYEVLMKHQNPDKDVKALQVELGKILGK